ncbi:hypothetical protein LCE31_27460, partial [Streptomyces sp. 8L]|nr:hypothetical protein [Streptomyces sp. 8L]
RTPAPAPPPPPPPRPKPSRPRPAPSARPTPSAVALPHYRKTVRKQPVRHTSPVLMMLLITAPAVLAVAVLRPRSR